MAGGSIERPGSILIPNIDKLPYLAVFTVSGGEADGIHAVYFRDGRTGSKYWDASDGHIYLEKLQIEESGLRVDFVRNVDNSDGPPCTIKYMLYMD